MGTRSLTVINDNEGVEICVLYRQLDGYLKGHGEELKSFLQEFVIESGLGLKKAKRTANGMDCLAAQIVAHFKKEAGGFYLFPAGARDCGEEYIYTVYMKDEKLRLKIEAGAVTFFGLPGTKQKNMPIIYEGNVELFDSEEVQKKWNKREENPPNDYLDYKVLSSKIVTES
jgi:hypothetical protein